MKVIYNTFIPFKGYLAINLFGVLFVRKNSDGTCPDLSETVLNHESIHSKQMKGLLWIGFYLWYVIEWIVRLIQYKKSHDAYRNISFEREAYANEDDLEYIDKTMKLYSWTKYLKEK